MEELAKILGEELELPNIQPKGKRTIMAEKADGEGCRLVMNVDEDLCTLSGKRGAQTRHTPCGSVRQEHPVCTTSPAFRIQDFI